MSASVYRLFSFRGERGKDEDEEEEEAKTTSPKGKQKEASDNIFI